MSELKFLLYCEITSLFLIKTSSSLIMEVVLAAAAATTAQNAASAGSLGKICGTNLTCFT